MIDSSHTYVNYTGKENFWTTVPSRVIIPVDRYRNKQFQLRFTIDDGTNYPVRLLRGLEAAAPGNIKVCGSDTCEAADEKAIPLQRGKTETLVSVKQCTDSTYFTHQYTAGDSLLLSFQLMRQFCIE